jgi:hypothetical protein
VKREALFSAWWRDASGVRAKRATRLELQEAQRLWWKHRDLREPLAKREGQRIA